MSKETEMVIDLDAREVMSLYGGHIESNTSEAEQEPVLGFKSGTEKQALKVGPKNLELKVSEPKYALKVGPKSLELKVGDPKYALKVGFKKAGN